MSGEIFVSTDGPAREPVDSAELEAAESTGTIVADPRRRRPRYFDGRFLAARDLTRDQTYFLMRQADLGRIVGGGVGHGLTVSVDQPGRSMRIDAGHGLTPSGEMVVLREDISVDVTEIPQIQLLDAVFGLEQVPRPPTRSRSGLFILALRPVEYTANPVASYPTSLTGDRGLEEGEVIEAVAVSLIPYPLEGTPVELRAMRSHAAREIFHLGGSRGTPAGVLPLAMVALRRGLVDWIDPWLVRREAGAGFSMGFGNRGVREAFMRQHDTHLREVESAHGNGDAAFSAADYFSVLPPVGRLPRGTVSARSGQLTQIYFPAEMKIQISIVPNDELPALVEESLNLPPIDLQISPEAMESVAVLVLLPLPRAVFDGAVNDLRVALPDGSEADPRITNLPSATLTGLARLKPIQALTRLQGLRSVRAVIQPPRLEINPWERLLGDATTLLYVRQRNVAHAADAEFRYRLPGNVVIVGDDGDSHWGNVAELGEVFKRLEDSRELERYDAFMRNAEPSVRNHVIETVSNDQMDRPLLVTGLIFELENAQARGASVEAVTTRYRRVDLGTGIDHMVEAQPRLDELQIRRNIGQALVVPEIDQLAIRLGSRDSAPFALFVLVSAEEERILDLQRIPALLESIDNPLYLLSLRIALRKIETPEDVEEFRRDSLYGALGGGLSRLTSINPALLRGRVPARLFQSKMLGILDAAAARVPAGEDWAIKDVGKALIEAAATSDVAGVKSIINLFHRRVPL